MANKYWVGGTGNWGDIAHWSLTSGGAGGAPVPDATDAVLFNSASFPTPNAIITLPAGQSYQALSMVWTPTATNAPQLILDGTLTLTSTCTFSSNMTSYNSGTLILNAVGAQRTLTFGTFTFYGGDLQFGDGNPNSYGYTLGSDIDVLGDVRLYSGTLAQSTRVINCTNFIIDDPLGLNAGRTWSSTSSTAILYTSNVSGGFYALAAYTSSLTSQTIYVGVKGFKSVSSNTYNIVNINTADNEIPVDCVGRITRLNLTLGPAYKYGALIVKGTLLTTTFTSTGISGVNRVIVRSENTGVPATISATTVTVTDTDFMDITVAGSNAWNLSAVASRVGDAGGNTGITFRASQARYWVGGSGTWGDRLHWSLTSGGANGQYSPLPQDLVYFDTNSFGGATTATVTVGGNTGSRWLGDDIYTDIPSDKMLTLAMPTASETYNKGHLYLQGGVTMVGAGKHVMLPRESANLLPFQSTHAATIEMRSVLPGSVMGLGAPLNSTKPFIVSGKFFSSNNAINCAGFTWNSFSLTGDTTGSDLGTSVFTLEGVGTLFSLTGTIASSGASVYSRKNSTPSAYIELGGNGLKLLDVNALVSPSINYTYIRGVNAELEMFRVSEPAMSLNFYDSPLRLKAVNIQGDAAATPAKRVRLLDANFIYTGTQTKVREIKDAIVQSSLGSPLGVWYAQGLSVNNGENTGWYFGSPNGVPGLFMSEF